MSDSHGGQHDQASHGAHESRDVKLRGILIFTAVLVLITIAIQLALGLWMAIYSNDERDEAARQTARQADPEGQFPGPLLQGNPGADTTRYEKVENRLLDSYGWTSKEKKVAHIPIERAMQVLVTKGLPLSGDSGSPSK